MNDLVREICKLGLKLDFTAHGIMEYPEFVLCKRTSVGQLDANRLEHQQAVFPAGRYVGSRDRRVFKGIMSGDKYIFLKPSNIK
jgi:hypothetical protein